MKREEVEALIAELVTPILADTDISLADVEYVREKTGISAYLSINPEESNLTIASMSARNWQSCWMKKTQ